MGDEGGVSPPPPNPWNPPHSRPVSRTAVDSTSIPPVHSRRNRSLEGDPASMRRALAAFLILSLLGGQAGMLGALLGRHHARQQMHQRISAASKAPETAEAVRHLTLSRTERQSPSSSFTRIDEREFRYRGNLYDIVHQEWRGSDWHVWVLHDREEEQYLDALAQSMNTPMLRNSTVPPHRHPIEPPPPALVPSALASPPAPLWRSQPFPRSSVPTHQGPYLEVPHPPPWG